MRIPDYDHSCDCGSHCRTPYFQIKFFGAPWNDLKTGAAYHYKLSGSTWSQFFKVMARDRAQQDQFGANLGLSGRRVIIGSRLDDKGTVNNVGAGYILNLK